MIFKKTAYIVYAVPLAVWAAILFVRRILQSDEDNFRKEEIRELSSSTKFEKAERKLTEWQRKRRRLYVRV